MNKHFHDSLYYLKRAGEHARLGIEANLEPVVERARRAFGRDDEPEPEAGRLETVRRTATDLEHRVERRARTTVGTVREAVPGGDSGSDSSDERKP
ncbi:DUF7553 family protein [Natrarchaeobius oligotrophus]|uniref:Uncharacterized protein n=1 Tax=Natrarchaeobius chitinivorans TaxID=1679083 RepID=A0A3N6M532_NATCH|nr:hypothetical protein [Natrarchaeobius chitinivorans]RQG98668.1 hypothetical protein EA472_16900 [Natrarchaeobius chitinivorans]